MSKFGDYCASQCGNPRGVIGKIMTLAMNRVNNVMYKGIIAKMEPQNSEKVLDIGFGNGYLEKLIYRQAQCQIEGVDISEDMVKAATKNNKEAVSKGKIHFAVGDCCNLVFDDSSFDMVVTMNTIYFWSDTIKGLKEIHRVLKDDGVFYNAVLTKESLDNVFYTKNGFKKFDDEEYIQMGKEVGFDDISITPLDHKYGILIEYRK